ncbi:MAG: WbuC family cupin fold metalloprotein [Marinilabiliaceae bacterium]|nr:WbuC family cupin fold metalloprotein [Marinilabiliaceae bacterium]
MKLINSSLLDQLVIDAECSHRKRKNYNFHQHMEDTMHRMLNAIQPGSYVQPHKHQNPDKREVFLILKGRLLAILFSEDGTISQKIILDPREGNFGIEIPPGRYHTIISLEEGTVAYEIKDGPYTVADDKDFAPWAPDESNKEKSKHYMEWLLAEAL